MKKFRVVYKIDGKRKTVIITSNMLINALDTFHENYDYEEITKVEKVLE
jgi:hypothetical protein